MITILRFFANNALLIYLVLAIGLLFAVRGLLKGRGELGQSVFGLERELAYRHLRQSVTILATVFLLALSELLLTAFLIPYLPAFSILTTPTFNPLTTQTGTLPPQLLASLGALTPQPTATARSSGCIPGQIMITYPKPGDVIKGTVQLLGVADIPNFAYYYYEFSLAGSDTWQTVAGDNKIPKDTRLGPWDTSLITPGFYNLRLVVTDAQANKLPPCIIPVQISAP
jgi:hypothetical protein